MPINIKPPISYFFFIKQMGLIEDNLFFFFYGNYNIIYLFDLWSYSEKNIY